MPPVALTIAGSDPSGGAGIQADLKTFHQFGVYGEAVITLLTIQNTLRVDRVECISCDVVAEQVAAVIEDIPPAAVKTGALGNADIVKVVAGLAAAFSFPLVVDPVMISKHGTPLMAADAIEALARDLIPRAYLVTPNIPEAAALTGIEIRDAWGVREAARRIASMGPCAVLVKGGHMPGCATDLLWHRGECLEFTAGRVDTVHTHGTGCTYSAAITAELARGTALDEAVRRAKAFITEAIRTSPGLGRGSGPVNHHACPGLAEDR
jgi:hydroxymethylpyrimidine/phosphomethylpyrimidine kinase